VNGIVTNTVTDADGREVLDYDGTSGQILRWATYGPGLDGVLNWMEVAAGTRTTLIPDVQGSVIATLDATGGTMTRTAYLPFGESGTAPAVSGYAGRRYDAETGFYNNRSRIYHPGWGRFLQADPIGTPGGGTCTPMSEMTRSTSPIRGDGSPAIHFLRRVKQPMMPFDLSIRRQLQKTLNILDSCISNRKRDFITQRCQFPEQDQQL